MAPSPGAINAKQTRIHCRKTEMLLFFFGFEGYNFKMSLKNGKWSLNFFNILLFFYPDMTPKDYIENHMRYKGMMKFEENGISLS